MIGVATQEQLERIAAPKAPEPVRSDYSRPRERFDVEGWIQKHGLVVTKTKLWQGGNLYELEVCPFNPEHRREARITQNAEGALGFQCFHNSCADKNWRALRDLLEPNRPGPPASQARPATTAPGPGTEADTKKHLTALRAHAVGNLIPSLKAEIAVNAQRDPNLPLGLSTGFRFLDRDTEGFVPGEMWTLGGFTSTGKTAVAIQMVSNLLATAPEATLGLFSLEMSSRANILRLLANRTGIPTRAIRRGNLTDGDGKKIDEAFAWLMARQDRLYLFDSTYSLSGIATTATWMKETTGLSVLFIDYIQNITGKGTLYERMSLAAPRLQKLAKDLDMSVVLLSQISNEMAKADDEGDGASNYLSFKGAGEIAAAADVGLWLRRDKGNPANLLCAIRKNKEGRQSKCTLIWSDNYTRLIEPTDTPKK